MQRFDVVIIGAGPGGLAAAMLLSQSGMRVKLIERQPRVGGRTSGIEEQGFRFDLGPTFFLYPRVLEEIFQTCGRKLFDEVPMKRLDPQYRLIFGAGGKLDCTPDVDRMTEAIALIDPDDAVRFRHFLEDNRRKLAAFRPVLESPWDHWQQLLTPAMLKILPLLRPWVSLDGDLKRFFRDPRLRLAFSFQSKYLGMSPFRCPSLFSILSFLEYEHGVFHPLGGCHAVSEGMARVAAAQGVDISCGEEVIQLKFEGRRVVGAITTADEYTAEAFVINADFAHTMSKLVPDHLRRRWTNKKLSKKRYSCSTFMLYLGIDGLEKDLAHHSIYISADYERNLDDIENQHVLSTDPSVYVQNACVTDPELAPAGQSTLYVLAPVSHQHPNINWATEQGPFRERVLKQVEEKLGVPELAKRIRFERVVTPADWEDQYSIYRGATFNLAHTLTQMLHLRPNNRFEDLNGVYLVGGGTHPGSGLPVIYESARITSRLVQDDLGSSSRKRVTTAAGFEPAYGQSVSSRS